MKKHANFYFESAFRLSRPVIAAITISVLALWFYTGLPALSFASPDLYWFLGFGLLGAGMIYRASPRHPAGRNPFFLAIGILAACCVIALAACSPLFCSGYYAKQITITPGDFADDVAEADLSNVPLLDRDSTEQVGDRVMGQLPELVSQFRVSDLYTQIDYNGRLVRVTPLEYDGFFKWLNNRTTGTPGYILVDSTTGEARLVTLQQGMRYLPSGWFGDQLARHLRFSYPTAVFGESVFEIDESGKPYWVTPMMNFLGIGEAPDVSSVIITDPATGANVRYRASEVPEWVDHVYPSAVINDQLNNSGGYGHGFWNRYFGQKNVTQVTSGYNYISCNLGKDVCLYTGITSAADDESNLGFILANLRTKETNYYEAPGAEEYSAMSTAEGAVQEKGYKATFPILINLDNRPTYLLSLKDDAGLVKAYAFVDAQDYQQVTVTDSAKGIAAASAGYRAQRSLNEPSGPLSEGTGVIQDIRSVVISGNTIFYLKIDGVLYAAPASLSRDLPFYVPGDTVSFTYDSQDTVSAITTVP